MQPSNLPPETFVSAHLLKKYVLHTYYEPDVVQNKGLGDHNQQKSDNWGQLIVLVSKCREDV